MIFRFGGYQFLARDLFGFVLFFWVLQAVSDITQQNPDKRSLRLTHKNNLVFYPRVSRSPTQYIK